MIKTGAQKRAKVYAKFHARSSLTIDSKTMSAVGEKFMPNTVSLTGKNGKRTAKENISCTIFKDVHLFKTTALFLLLLLFLFVKTFVYLRYHPFWKTR